MKSCACKFASLALITAVAVFAHAQSRITVDVPFNFAVAGKTYPPGRYSVSSERQQLIVQDSASKTIFMAISNPISGRRSSSTGEVVFHCYASRCFLSEFWTPLRESGSQLLPSRDERELAKHWQRTEFALLDHKR